ncbi:hypothetical protein ACFQGX_30680 [Nonomuraea dietziae]|uniref:hypothetical protein n=1 Tax=Nonomuraea dietziae TaxID=65515 RepID=UPI00361DC5F2
MVEVAAERGKRSSSRTSEEGAGWRCQQIGSYKGLRPNTDTFSWFHPRTLWRSRNEILAGLFGDPSGEVRRRWVEAQRARGVDGDFRIRPGVGKSFSFLLLGDPGEGDDSQYAVVPGMLHVGADTSFAVIASDVVYPTGGQRVLRQVLQALQGLPGPRLRHSRQPRLVRRARRVHARLLRRAAAQAPP